MLKQFSDWEKFEQVYNQILTNKTEQSLLSSGNYSVYGFEIKLTFSLYIRTTTPVLVQSFRTTTPELYASGPYSIRLSHNLLNNTNFWNWFLIIIQRRR